MPNSFNRSFITLAITALSVFCSSTANAQTMSHPDSISPLKPNPYLKHQDPWRWDIRTQVFLRAGVQVYIRGEYREERTGSWDIQDFEFIYPVVRQGGYYWSPNEKIDTELRIDDAEYAPEHKLLMTPDSKVPYTWWKSNQRDRRTHQLHITQVSHVVCADTVFNEKLAKELPWPKAWPDEAERFLTPIIDQIQEPIDIDAQDELSALVDRWLEGNDPKSIDEVTLTKYLTGKVIEHVRVVRGSVTLAPILHRPPTGSIVQGFSSSPLSSWSGFHVRSADQVVKDPRGSALDLSTLLNAVLRTAGVPARTLVVYDNSEDIPLEERLHAMVEFALYDKKNDQVLWIPIDIEKLRDHGRRSQYYEQRWDYFGTHDRLRNYVPLSYYFHPPVNYRAYGYPGLYGLKTIPDIGGSVSQVISIDVINSPIRGDEVIQKRTP